MWKWMCSKLSPRPYMGLNASVIANYFIKRSIEDFALLTLPKLMAMIYIAQGMSISYLRDPKGILGDEKLRAWGFGPVVKPLFHELKYTNCSPIRGYSQSTVYENIEGFDSRPIFIEQIQMPKRTRVIKLLEQVWDNYMDYSHRELMEQINVPGSPWEVAYHYNDTKIISNSRLNEAYAPIVRKILNNQSRQAKKISDLVP